MHHGVKSTKKDGRDADHFVQVDVIVEWEYICHSVHSQPRQ